MKIVLFGLSGRGGMIHYTSHYANALAKKCEVHVLLPEYSDTSLFDKKVKLIRVYAPPTVIGTAKTFCMRKPHLDAVSQIKKINPDAIHVMDNHPLYFFYLKRLKEFNVFTTLHDPKFHSGEVFTPAGLMCWMLHRMLKRISKKIIVHGEKWREYLAGQGIPKQDIIVVPIGEFSLFTKWKSTKKQERYSILCFGRIIRYKGIDTLIKSIKYVVPEIPELKVIIAGEGNFSPYKKLVTDENKEYIELHNEFISEQMVSDLFTRAAVVVLPYDDATQSGVIPVAYSFKKAVITTNVGSLPDVVDEGKTGYIVPPQDPEKLGKAIVKLLKSKSDIHQFGINADKKRKEMLNWDKIVDKIMREYKETSKNR